MPYDPQTMPFGDYIYEVDSNGCVDQAIITVTELTTMITDTLINQVSCYGYNDGSFTIIGNNIDQKNIEPKKPISFKKNEKVTTYLLGDVSVKWDAFKHNSKVPVGGRFENIEVTNFNDSSDLYGAVNGTEFTIDVNSTKTGDTLRDYKIYTFLLYYFFKFLIIRFTVLKIFMI